MKTSRIVFDMKNKLILTGALLVLAMDVGTYGVKGQKNDITVPSASLVNAGDRNMQRTIANGKQTFRYDTFGDQAFWGDAQTTSSN